jgi:hypothetical protein
MKDAMGNLQTERKRLEDMKHDLGEKLDSIATRLHDEYDIGWYEMDNYRGSRTPTVSRENIIKEKGEEAAALLDEWRNLSNQSEKFSDELSNKKQDMQEIVDTFDFPQQQQKHGQPTNTLAHIRLTDRNIDGRKVLFVEEIQSDWHQAANKKVPYTLEGESPTVNPKPARRSGYQGDPKNVAEIEKIESSMKELGVENVSDLRQLDDNIFYLESQLDDDLSNNTGNYEANKLRLEKWKEKRDKVQGLLKQRNKIADAPVFGPFSNTSDWTELALKKVLQEAADGGWRNLPDGRDCPRSGFCQVDTRAEGGRHGSSCQQRWYSHNRRRRVEPRTDG